jgi:hypothetical protein
VEEVLWRTVQRAFLGEMEMDDALKHMTEQISQIVRASSAAGAEEGS